MAANLLRAGCIPFFLSALLVCAPARAQQESSPATTYEPVVGQPGKDVIWVPTPQAAVDLMLDLAKLGPQDYVVDLGSGDGRIVVTAAKRGARGMGVDLNPDMVQLATQWAKQEGVADRAEFRVQDLFDTDIAKASVLTMYLLPHLNLRLRPVILSRLAPGSRVVSHSFSMDDWQPDAVRSANGRTVHLWIVPAPAMGVWRWENDGAGYDRLYEMQVVQRFQQITVTAKTANGATWVRDARLSGDRIAFTLTEESGSAQAQTEYEGRIEGDTITGTARTNGASIPQRWAAKRISGAGLIERRD